MCHDNSKKMPIFDFILSNGIDNSTLFKQILHSFQQMKRVTF